MTVWFFTLNLFIKATKKDMNVISYYSVEEKTSNKLFGIRHFLKFL